jgi:short-subunit dehydrogenase
MAHTSPAGKVVVITGASGGIGAALARRLGVDGHALALGARRRDALQAVADASVAAGAVRALAVETDVTRRDAVLALRDAALDAFGRVDVWVNNAGRGITRTVLELTDEDVDDMMTVNVKSALYGMQAIAPHFVERGAGHVINVSSFLGRVPVAPFRSVYSAAKAALNSLTTNLRMDLREHPGIRVSLVMPGVVSTDFAANVRGQPVTPVPGGMPIQTAEEVGDQIAGLIAEPVDELYTNPAAKELLRRFYGLA